jgi:tRNA (adenine37-N6)-methyltransferase
MNHGNTHEPVFTINPVGVIRTPCKAEAGTPIQPVFGQQLCGEVEVFEGYEQALADIEGFERLWLVYLLDRASAFKLRVVPYRDTVPRGLFATRAPSRPNPIGISAVRLLGREGRILRISDLDILDGTPLIDIKPYVPAFDAFPGSSAGWMDETTVDRRFADGRFSRPE